MKWTRLTIVEKTYGQTLLIEAFQTRDIKRLEEFYMWLEDHIVINIPVAKKAFDKLFYGGHQERAIKLFHAAVPDGYNPVVDNILHIVFWPLREGANLLERMAR